MIYSVKLETGWAEVTDVEEQDGYTLYGCPGCGMKPEGLHRAKITLPNGRSVTYLVCSSGGCNWIGSIHDAALSLPDRMKITDTVWKIREQEG